MLNYMFNMFNFIFSNLPSDKFTDISHWKYDNTLIPTRARHDIVVFCV